MNFVNFISLQRCTDVHDFIDNFGFFWVRILSKSVCCLMVAMAHNQEDSKYMLFVFFVFADSKIVQNSFGFKCYLHKNSIFSLIKNL